MYQRILVAVDGSSASDLALAEALRLAREHRSQVHIAHVIDAASLFAGEFGFVDVVEVEKALVAAGNQTLKAAAAAAAKAGVQADTRLLEIGDLGARVATMIADEAKAWAAELVVIGTHGRRGLGHLFLGSVAEGVMRISPVPVLLVRGGANGASAGTK